MLKTILFKIFFVIFTASLFLFLPADQALAKLEISLDGNSFDPPFPPYRIKQDDPPKPFPYAHPGPVHAGTPVRISGIVTGCSTSVDVQAWPVSNPKKVITNINSNWNNIINFFNPAINYGSGIWGIVKGLQVFNVAQNSFEVNLPEPGGYYIYAKCGNSTKYEFLDVKYIEVYDANPTLPPAAPTGPAVLGGGYCPDGQSIDTAIGCIPTQPSRFVEGVMKFSIGIAGGLALLIMAFAAIQMVTSQGNPEALKKAQGQFTSAIIGLLFIIFSVLILQIIGVDLLNIPGFTK